MKMLLPKTIKAEAKVLFRLLGAAVSSPFLLTGFNQKPEDTADIADKMDEKVSEVCRKIWDKMGKVMDHQDAKDSEKAGAHASDHHSQLLGLDRMCQQISAWTPWRAVYDVVSSRCCCGQDAEELLKVFSAPRLIQRM